MCIAIAQAMAAIGDNCWTDRTRSCILTVTRSKWTKSPQDPPRCEPIEAVPPPQGSRLRGPATPKGRPFPVLRLPCRRGGFSKVRTSGPDRSVLRPRPHAARGSQRAGHHRGAARGRGDASRVHPGRGAALPGVQPRRRDAAVDGAGPPGRDASPGVGARRWCRRRRSRPRRCCSTSCSPSPGRSSTSTGPRAARSCWPPPRRTTS